MSKKEFIYKVNKNYSNVSLEQFFKMFYLGKDKINSLIFNGNVLINEEIKKDKTYKLHDKDVIKIVYNIEKIKKFDFQIKIIYEDDYILIVNKPHKILVHPDGNTSKTLMNAVHNYLSKKVENTFAYPVHRIDFDTTGIVVFAKDPLTLSFLSMEIENHNLIKKYVCLCYNRFPSLSGKIEKNISKDRHSNKQIISKNGKEAISYYKVLENGSVSKVEVTIIHGRTHQIRVHMQSINHPLLGDKIYGKDDGYDLKLHFKNISFFHPFKGEKIFIECEEQF